HKIARTITALSIQDERIADEFRAIQRGRRPSGKIVEIEGDVPVGMKIRLGDFAEAISTRIWDSVGRANWRPFKEARNFVRGLSLKSDDKWRAYCGSGMKPVDIPSNPQRVYAKTGWAGMGDWLGTGAVATYRRQYRPFKEARSFARGLGLKSYKEWQDYCNSGKLPADIPSSPVVVYARSGWVSTGDWLG